MGADPATTPATMTDRCKARGGAADVSDRGFMWSEQLLYSVAGLILVAGALALLVDAIVAFVSDLGDDVVAAAAELLSVLLLVFVFVELLGAVRVTIRERRLIAEPFLLVGIIASIKEIVVVAAPTPGGRGWPVQRAMIELACSPLSSSAGDLALAAASP